VSVGDAVAGARGRRGTRPARLRERAGRLSDRAIAVLDTAHGGWITFGAVGAVSLALALWLTRNTTFWLDETYFFTGNRGYDLQYLLTPHNGQLILGPRFVYATVFKLFGPDYAVFRVIEAVGVVAVAALVHALARRRIRGALALAPAILMLFFGSVGSVTLAPLGMINVYCVAAGLAAMLLLGRRGRFADPLAAFLIAVSISFWSPGLAFAIGALVLILRDPGWRGRLWVIAVPLGLYVLWWVTQPGLAGPLYGTLELKLANVLVIPAFSVDSTGWIASAVTGLDYGFGQPPPAFSGAVPDNLWGPILASVAIAAIAVALRRLRRSSWPWPWLAVLLVLWASTALATSPLRTPGTSRYVYVGAAAALVLVAEVAGRFAFRARIVGATYAVLLLALAANIAMLRDTGTYLRAQAVGIRADLAAVELARGHVSPDFVPTVGAISTTILGPAVTAGPYLAAVDRNNGSFAYTLPELRAAPESDREDADQILAQAFRLHLVPARAPARGPGCRRASPAVGGAIFPLPPGGARLRASGSQPASVALRRFGDAFAAEVGRMAPGRSYSLAIPRDVAPDRWSAQVTASGPVVVCPL
jgi:hypothetical protein